MEPTKNTSDEPDRTTGGSSSSGTIGGFGGSVGSSSFGGSSGSTDISNSSSQMGTAPQRALEQSSDSGQSAYDQTKQTVTDAYGKTTEVLTTTYDQAMSYGHENPGKLTLIAFSAGIGIGLLLAGSGGRSRTNRVAEPLIKGLSQLALEFFREEESILGETVKVAATATVAAVALDFAKQNAQSTISDNEPPNRNSPKESQNTLTREPQNINQVFSALVAAENFDLKIVEQVCSDAKTISWRFEGAPTLDAFYERNLVDDGRLNIDLDFTRKEMNNQVTSRIAIIGVYPSNAVLSIPAQISLIDNKLLVTLEDPFVLLDPNKVEPTFDIPSFQAEVTLFAIKL